MATYRSPGPVSGSRGRRARSVERERSGDDLAGRLVRTDHDARGRDGAVDELQTGGDGAVREQALARPKDEGEDPQLVLVDKVVAQERLDQVPAAMDLQVGPVSLLERGDAFGRVSLDQDRIAPRQRGVTSRGDVLGGVVEWLGALLL